MCDNDYGMGGVITSYKEQQRRDDEIKAFEQSLQYKRKKNKGKSQKHKPVIDHNRMNDANLDDEKGSSSAPTQFTYTQLLQRIYGELNTEMDHDDETAVIPAPTVFRHGSKKTAWTNLVEIARFLQRDPNHLKQFVETELTTNTNFDGSRYLVLSGRWTDAHIRSVVKKYTNSFVVCTDCKSLDTWMSRNNSTRLFDIECNKCHSQRSCKRIEKAFKTIANKAQRIQQRQQAQLQRQRQT